MQSTMFTTPHFTIRKLTTNDLSPFHEMQGNVNVMRYTDGKANTLEENRLDLAKLIQHYADPNNLFWVWAIERQSDKAFLGTCALIGTADGTYEIGYRFLEKYWGKGYGKEIAQNLIDYAFCQAEVKNIIAYVDVRNEASVKLLDQSTLAFMEEIYNKELNATERFYKMEIIDEEKEVIELKSDEL